MSNPSPSIVWRAYRDPDRAPVPVVTRTATAAEYRFIPEVSYTGDTAHVEPYAAARGVLSGTIYYDGDTLPSQLLASEPVLLTLKRPYGTIQTRLAVAARFSGEGPNPYRMPFMAYDNPASPVLVVPGLLRDSGDTSLRTFRAVRIAERVFKIPPGWADLEAVVVKDVPYHRFVDYDYRHGTLYLDAYTEGDVSVSVRAGRTLRYAAPSAQPGVHPVVLGGELLGFITVTPRLAYRDARRLPESAGGGRVDEAYYDGDPTPEGHLWIIESAAEPALLEAAVRRTMPLGTLYRQVHP